MVANKSNNLGFEHKENENNTVSMLKESFLKAFKGQDLVIGNVGDSRALLGTGDTDDSLISVQLTDDHKPKLPNIRILRESCTSMASEAMDVADACPTEDIVAALLEYLVDPKLQGKSSAQGDISQIAQESIAKQQHNGFIRSKPGEWRGIGDGFRLHQPCSMWYNAIKKPTNLASNSMETEIPFPISCTIMIDLRGSVHAVVLLYNYYHRKQHPQLEFLCFENFCKLAVVVKPALLAHVRLFQRSNDTESQPFPLMEERIMEACSISMSLDASEDDLNIDGWPISKVAVFLVDSRKENCFLQFGSITDGVWSVIEKDVDGSNDSPKGTMDSNPVTVNKKKRIIKKPLKGKSSSNGAGFQQFAFSAVKEATGIDQSDLMVLESHVTYSTSKEKTAAYFYIMQLTKADNSVALQTPIEDAINSLQGPLAIKNSIWWTHTSVVEYFHLLPYAEVLSDWLLREGLSNRVQVQSGGLETVNVSSTDRTERPCEAEVSERFHNHVNDSAAELRGSEAIARPLKHNDNTGCLGSEMNSLKQNDNDTCCMVDSTGDDDRPRKIDVDESPVARTQNKYKRRNVSSKYQPQKCLKKTNTAVKCLKGSTSKKMETVEKCSKGSTSDDKINADMVDQTISQKITGCTGAVVASGNKNCNYWMHGCSKNMETVEKCSKGSTSDDKIKADMVDQTISQKFTGCTGAVVANGNNNCNNIDANGNKNCNNIVADQDRLPATDHAVVKCQSNSKDLVKLCTVLASKDKELSHTALTFVLSRRDKLSLQQRDIEDQIAQCDKDIETILKGGENNLSLKIESLIEGCNGISLRNASRERACEDQCSSPSVKRKSLPDTDLDDVCYKHNWILPTYHVSSQDGGFQANVTVKGTDFKWSSGGDLCPRPREARESAAQRMSARLQNMPNNSS
ncbi:unnamed protein product [Dovyalis caffra]|uniref:PPM-type phosphatase domain-containing protein n=1 Tax=Dovyalis caffra TaxID=77055 RepID=A0AAV1QLP3_9ROSI|nr:unnamed protein product [Dovyalis caffra]